MKACGSVYDMQHLEKKTDVAVDPPFSLHHNTQKAQSERSRSAFLVRVWPSGQK